MDRRIDELYGLEPVYEPGDADRGAAEDPAWVSAVDVDCPYCGERFGTTVDISAGPQTYIEDCQVCCQPIEMRLTVGDAGEFVALEPVRIYR